MKYLQNLPPDERGPHYEFMLKKRPKIYVWIFDKSTKQTNSENGTFFCRFCPEEFDKSGSKYQTRQYHVLDHFKKEFYKVLPSLNCPICKNLVRDKVSLSRHYAFSHRKISAENLLPRAKNEPVKDIPKKGIKDEKPTFHWAIRAEESKTYKQILEHVLKLSGDLKLIDFKVEMVRIEKDLVLKKMSKNRLENGTKVISARPKKTKLSPFEVSKGKFSYKDDGVKLVLTRKPGSVENPIKI